MRFFGPKPVDFVAGFQLDAHNVCSGFIGRVKAQIDEGTRL
jgi:hypothetical protein